MAIYPVCYGAARRFWEHWPVSEYGRAERRAALFRRSVVGCESLTPADVRDWRAGFGAWLEQAVLVASGMADTDDADGDADGISNPKPDDYEAPSHSLIASGQDLSPAQNLAEFRESDTIQSLHESGYRWEELNRLLMPEIETLSEGVERQSRRAERED